MTLNDHWERIFRTKRIDEVSWYRPHLETSLELIRQAGAPSDAPIIDVGGGASTLIDDLLAEGYSDLTLLDLSEAALDAVRTRLGPLASQVTFMCADITVAVLPAGYFRVWHDRAVFHFLTDVTDRDRYITQVRHAVKPGGHIIVGTFGPDGPQRCSGLPTARYDAETLHAIFGEGFELVDRREERHLTPAGVAQQFAYCLCRRRLPAS